MNKNILLSILVVIVAAALINMGTMSYFSDTEIVEDNVLQAGDLDLKFVGPEEEACDLELSFLHGDDFVGVDDPTTWSTTDNIVELGISEFEIFGGTGTVSAEINGVDGDLTHRGTRGLGVYGTGDDNEEDEIDYREVGTQERIYVNLDTPRWLCKFEVRSLFPGEGAGGEPEVGDVRLWLEGEVVDDFHFEAESDATVNGVKVVDTGYYLVDRIMFHIDEENAESDYSPARLYFANYCMQDNEYYETLGTVWEMNHMKPGMEDMGTLVFNEDGSNMGNFLDFDCYYQAYEDDDGDRSNGYNPGPEPDPVQVPYNDTMNDTFASYIEITEMEYHCDSGAVDDLLTQITDDNGNGWKDINDFKESALLTVDLNDNGVNGDYLTMNIRFHPDAGNEYQGDIFDFWVIFTLRYQ